jgi:hypothetical protein
MLHRVLVAAVTAIDPAGAVSRAVPARTVILRCWPGLFVHRLQVRFLPFKLCPLIFAASALIFIGGVM